MTKTKTEIKLMVSELMAWANKKQKKALVKSFKKELKKALKG